MTLFSKSFLKNFMNFNEKNKTFRAFLKNEVYASYIPQKSANII